MPVQVRPAVPETASGDNRPFWAIFYAKKTARRGATPRLYSLPDELSSSCGLYCPPLCIPTLNNKNAYPVNPPPSAPMSAAGMRSVCSRSATIAPTRAPARAGMMMIVAIATIMMSRCPIRMIKSLLKKCFTRDQGLLSPFDKSRKLNSIIQLILRNVKRIFMRGYILQIAVLIAASGAFGDQIK